MNINENNMLQASSKGYLNATDMADYLVVRGMAFREAHSCVGKAVSYAISKNKELHELELKELRSFSSLIQNDIFDILTLDQMINRRTSAGGTATENVTTAIKVAEKCLK